MSKKCKENFFDSCIFTTGFTRIWSYPEYIQVLQKLQMQLSLSNPSVIFLSVMLNMWVCKYTPLSVRTCYDFFHPIVELCWSFILQETEKWPLFSVNILCSNMWIF